jgi:hypothetical protein
MRSFFAYSDLIDHGVLRPLSHISGNWELTWNAGTQKYEEEDDSYTKLLNLLIEEIENTIPPAKYHDNEDRLAEYTQKHLNWNIRKEGGRWVGAEYGAILEQGGFHDFNQSELILAAAGRVRAARNRGQNHFDEIEESHRRILADVLTIILYHRTKFE